MRYFSTCVSLLLVAISIKASQDTNNPYPDIDEYQYVNYAASGNQQQVYYDYVDHQQEQNQGQQNVIYDYVDHSGYGNGGSQYSGSYYEDSYDNGNRYYIDEKAPNQYDYSSRDYRKVDEGTEGTYEEMGQWHYEPRHGSFGGYSGYNSYGGSGYGKREEVHHHHHYGGDGGQRGDYQYRSGGYEAPRQYYQSSAGSNSDGFLMMAMIVIVIGVLAALACAFVVQRNEAKRKERVLENVKATKVLSEAPSAPVNSSEPVFFQGQCYVDGPVTDSKFGVVTKEHPIMYRDVQVFCWVQREENVEEKKGNQVRHGKKYHYQAKWVSEYVDSRSFRDQKYNQNVRPDVNSEVFQGGSNVRIGTYYSVAVNELEKAFGLTKLNNMFKHAPLTSECDKNGIWSHDSKNGCLVRQRNPGKDTVGDVRVSYRVLNEFEGIGSREIWASVCGIPMGNRMTTYGPLKGSVLPGRKDLHSLLDKLTK